MELIVKYAARRAKAIVKYQKEDVTAYLNPYLKNLSYTDNLSGQADDLQITLEDRGHLWQQSWMPDRGTTLEAGILTENWPQLQNISTETPLGIFEVDELESSGPPSEVTIKAVSVPYNNNLRGVTHTRSWEKATLKTIANDVAVGAEMELFWDTEENPVIDCAEQTEQSDLSFLVSLCEANGLALKVAGTKIVIFDEMKYEAAEPVLTIVMPGSSRLPEKGLVIAGINSYRLNCKIRDVYAACTVTYQQSKTKSKISGSYQIEGKKGRTLFINEQVDSIAAAERLAKKRLREKNKEETTASFTLIGCTILAAGSVVALLGFGEFDGNYIITKAAHTLHPFTTNIEIRRCLNGY